MTWRRMKITVCVVLCLGARVLQADVTLVRDGKSQVVIHVPESVMAEDDKALPQLSGRKRDMELQRQRLRESVKDLAHYLGKMSGAKVEIVTQLPPKNETKALILIGEFARTAFGTPQKQAPYKQGFRMVVASKGAGLIGLDGESDLAVSYAIFEVLDRLGCRWFMPGELGESIPEMKTITLPEVDFSSAPGTIYRGVWYADEPYKRRNRHGGLLLSAGHALEFYITKEEREQHPEWIGTYGGKPSGVRLKWSSPTLAEAIATKLIAMQDKAPTDSYSLSPEDGIDFDESAEDKALDAGDIDSTIKTVSITDRLMVLTNKIADRVTKKYPDVLFGMLAYAQYTRPPVREKLHPSVVPQIAPITYSRAHPMTDDAVPDNKVLRHLFEGWGKASTMTSVYFYGWFLAEPSAPNPMLAKWGTDVPIVLQNKCQFWQPETQGNFESSMHALYLGCRLAWNPTLKPADVFEEINSRFYGSAAKEMTTYWQFIDDCWTKTPEYSGCGFAYLRRWTPERMQNARKLLNAGMAACKTPLESRRVKLADESLQLFELFMKLRLDQAEGRFENLAAEGDKWMKKVASLAEEYKDNFTFTKVNWNPATLNGAYFSQFYLQTYNDASRIAKDFRIISKPMRDFRFQADQDKQGESQGFAKADFDDSKWKSTDVCVETWSAIGYHDWFKSMWYRTDVQVPEVPAGKKVFLWVGSTDGSAKVFVNGKHIPYVDAKGVKADDFNGFCQPISFDVTEAIKPGAKNQISILCTRTFFNELGTGGLMAPVVLYAEKP